MKKILESSSVILLFAIILITGISGCGSESNSNNTNKKIKVTIPFDLSAKALQKSYSPISPPSQGGDGGGLFYGPAPSNVRSIRVDAVYRDGRKIPSTIDVSGGTYVEVNMEVDAGDYVFFNAFAYDGTGGTGNLLYLGASSPQSLLMGMYYDIIIQMSAYSATSPAITSVTPANGSTGVPTSSILTVIFSTQMDHSTINDSTVTTSPHIGCYGSGGSGTTATCTPSPALSPNTTYTITFTTGVKNLAGNAMASSYTWSFTTGADGGGGGGGGTTTTGTTTTGTGTTTTSGDTTPPTVSSVTPISGATSVPSGTASGIITVIFSEAMDSASLNGSTISISPSLALSISYTTGTTTVTLSPPGAGFAASTTYTVTISGVKDSAGNTMSGSYSWSFTTASSGGGGGTSLPSAFNFSLPLNNETGVLLTPTLSWTTSIGATGYAIEIATDITFATIVHSTTVGSDVISHTVPSGKLVSSTNYWWTVKAINSFGHTIVSNSPFKFTTQ